MPKYMFHSSYTPAAAAAFATKPQDRVAGVKALVDKLGGRLDSLDYCFGEFDIVVTVTMPDDIAATAVSLLVNGAGPISAFRNTRLMSSEDFLAAQQKAHGVTYVAPARA